MRAARIGNAANQVEAEMNAAGLPEALELHMALLQPRLVRHSGRHEGLAVDALDRHVGIQLERPPGHHGFVLGTRRDREVEAPLPQITPGTDGVGIDVDTHIAGLASIVPAPLMGVGLNRYDYRLRDAGRDNRWHEASKRAICCLP